MATTTAFCEVLNQGISSGRFVDTKVILYSRRDSSGRIYQPKALYAASHVLKTVPYFQDLLFGEFAESQSKEFGDAIDEDYAEDYGYSSDSDLEDDDDGRPPLEHIGKPDAHSTPSPIRDESDVAHENHKERVEKGKVVKISDMAFVTFQAFLMYLYTDTIEFAPFGSEENRKQRSAEIIDPSDNKIPRTSPKSIYRLADKYDVPALKSLALNHIRSQMASCDIIGETFSRFASQYDEVRNLYIQRLAFNWMEDTVTEKTRTSLKDNISILGEMNPEHAAEVLSELFEIASKDGEITDPADTSDTDTPIQSPNQWVPVRTALIKSIREGVFFDKKYWARRSKAAEDLVPVHFSSLIMNDKAQQLAKLVKYFTGRNPPMGDLEGDPGAESDCEEDSLEASDKLQGTGEEREEATRALLTPGTVSAWKYLFFYRCTDSISFAPLKSQGVDSRSDYIRENTTTAAPPPCSPKSIYVLANILGISSLREKAFADIKSKVSLDNVMEEAFSWVTAGQKEITEMQCDLLIPELKNPQTIALVKENIRNISDRSPSRCADVLATMLEKAFEFKKQSTGVKLRCRYYRCSWSKEPVSYRYVGSSTYCPQCDDDYMECAGCGSTRNGNFPSCRGCRKRFI